jgi:phosphoglucomutase/phosphomannomutase
MTEKPSLTDTQAMLEAIQGARSAGAITESAAENIRRWISEPRYADYAEQVAQHVRDEKWQILDDVFWTVIPFGTGGRRGRMYPIGCNAINDRTIGESAQGLAEYVREHADGEHLSCGIAYDTRHRSPEFARLCAEIMVANGFQVFFLDDYRSTPELSFLVRYQKCSCGIMVTASHNPPSDNAVKVYWSTGGQVLPPHDKGIIARVMNVDRIERADFDQALADGKITLCRQEVDAAYLAELKALALPGPRDLKVLYSPLHGVGHTAVCPALESDGFRQVEVFAPHARPDGDFPNVPHHVANPENVEVFDAMIRQAQVQSLDLIMASDPDCDRLGCAAPLTADRAGAWKTFTGNQIGVLLADYLLDQLRSSGSLTADHYLVKTLVTTDMIRRIGDSYGVRTYGDLQVGFKWIAGVMEDVGPARFVLGAEESHGYLVGQHARDKDAAVAAMLFAELAARCQAEGQSLHEKLDALYWQHGYHAERLITQTMPGSEGMELMIKLMERFRHEPPSQLAGIPVATVRDYLHGTQTRTGSEPEPLAGPVGDLVIFDLADEGNYVAARPSGTEPKVKFYMFTFVPAEQLADLDQTRQEMHARLDMMAADLERFAAETKR